jgi:hypothetical protein
MNPTSTYAPPRCPTCTQDEDGWHCAYPWACYPTLPSQIHPHQEDGNFTVGWLCALLLEVGLLGLVLVVWGMLGVIWWP